MSTYKKKKYNSLRREWKEHREEYYSINGLYKGIERQFVVNVIKFCKEHKLANPLSKSSPRAQKVGGDENSSSFKSLYRKIAVRTHPDKNENKQDARDIYESATAAKQSGNLQELIDASNKAKIKPDIESFTLNELNLLEININELKNKINEIQNSYPWVWFHANQEKRNLILKDFIEYEF